MFGFMKSPLNNKITKQNSVDPPGSSTPNPFDSDSESDNSTKRRMKPARRASSEPVLSDLNSNPFDDYGDGRKPSSSSHSANRGGTSSYQNDFHDSGGFENQSVEELENYAVYKAEETTKSVDSCLKIAEDIREDASKTLVTLHQQGEQITRTHAMCQDIDQDLSRGEKILGSLGGMFSKTWKPKKTRAITGPLITADDSSKAKASKEQREKLGVAPIPKGPKDSRGSTAESSCAMQKVEEEKDKQDDALNGLSNILGDLKSMAVHMGSELERVLIIFGVILLVSSRRLIQHLPRPLRRLVRSSTERSNNLRRSSSLRTRESNPSAVIQATTLHHLLTSTAKEKA